MVDRADRLVALWSGAPGGTARCVAYAKRTGKPVDNLWPRWQALGSTPGKPSIADPSRDQAALRYRASARGHQFIC